MIDWYGEFDGMRIGRETEVLGRNVVLSTTNPT
jgi:hypothetical protein